jgi:hypothetical protein
MLQSSLHVLLLLPLLVESYYQFGSSSSSSSSSTPLAFSYDESSGTTCNNGYAISDLFVGCSLVGGYGQYNQYGGEQQQQQQGGGGGNGYYGGGGYGGYSGGTGGLGTECHMGDYMTVRGKITSTKSGIPLNAAVRFHACNYGWTTFFQTTCVELGSKYINTCTALYGMNPLSSSVCANVGTYDFSSAFAIPNYENILHMGMSL